MPPTVRRRRFAIALLVTGMLVAILAGCARPGAGSPDPSLAHPAGDSLVFRMATDGGFVPPGFIFTRLPELSVLGDGRVIVPGPMPTIYPGPSLPNLQVRRLSERGIQALLRAVLASGTFDADHHYSAANRRVMDGPTTVFSLRAGGREIAVSVYALGLLDSLDDVPGASPDERSAYAALTTLARRLGSLDELVGAAGWADAEWSAYTPAALRLLVRNADDDAPDPSGIPFTLVPWPVSGDPARDGIPAAHQQGRCAVATGSVAVAWLRALRSASALTRFEHDAHRYAVAVRPLLPDEASTCPAG